MVDSSVFIDFLRGESIPKLAELISSNEVLLSSFVRLELLQGVRRSEVKLLGSLLEGLLAVPWDEDLPSRAELLLQRVKGSGLNVGIVDLLIASQAQGLDCPVFSFDHVFRKLGEMGLIEVIEGKR